MAPKPSFISFFARHKVAPNLLMLGMIFGGVFALKLLNIQFFPNFALDMVNVVTTWTGASAEDVENDIVSPLEQKFGAIDYVREMTSTTGRGSGTIRLEMAAGTNIQDTVNRVRQQVDEFRNLPDDAEEPEVSNVVRYERIAHVLISGSDNLVELRRLANSFKQELISLGIDKVDISGVPNEQVSIEISSARLQELRMNLDQIGQRIGDFSRNIPAGTFGDADNARELRAIGQRRDEKEFMGLDIASDNDHRIELGSIATIERQSKEDGVTMSVDGSPAAELILRRSENGDTLKAARILGQWLEDTRATLPPNITLHVYRQSWEPIKERIAILLKNGLGGLVLVIAVLYLFLNARVAFWVALGIPVSFMAALLLLKLAGGSLNMISLFGLILTLGIIVDDAIVVGEDAYSHFQAGEAPAESVEGGAQRMLIPVVASSLTTIAAFLPIILISGIMGNIMFDIPLVVITVIMASLVESFLVLPGHLRHSLAGLKARSSDFRLRFDEAFERFKRGFFTNFLKRALMNRWTTLSVALAAMIIIAGLFAGNRIKFTFFPSPELSVIHATVNFVPGTPRDKVTHFLNHLESSSRKVDAELGDEPFIRTLLVRHGTTNTNTGSDNFGDSNLGSLSLELIDSDLRDVRNEDFIRLWREKIQEPAGLQLLSISTQEAVPDSSTVTLRITGQSAGQVKQAALALRDALNAQPNVHNIHDNMPYGKEQLIYDLTPAGETLGLTTVELGRQLRTAFEGRLVQIYQDGPDEVEVIIRLPESERKHLNALEKLEVQLISGETAPFSTVAELRTQTGFSTLRHSQGELSVDVSATIDRKSGNVASFKTALKQSILPEIERRFGVKSSFAGRTSDQAKSLSELSLGVYLGLVLIYLILAGVFSSYGWPFVVMSIIPFGLVGAVLGHLLMGLDLTLMSLLGLFGLSGIVVNDSIILLLFYRELREQGLDVQSALVEAANRRLRAVLLTSLTTIAGLVPLLFETSLQAQFLIPMAVSIAFGLAFSTLVVLILIPVLLSLHEDLYEFLAKGFIRTTP